MDQSTTRRSVTDTNSARAAIPPATPVTPQPLRSRRRPRIIALGVALVCVGGLSAAWLATSNSDATPVLAINRPVQAGETLSASDITTASISHDASIATIPGNQLQQVVGKQAAVPLTAGQVLTPDSVTETLVAPAGTSTVGVAVGPTQLPSEPLRGGQKILVVATANAQDDPPTEAPQNGIRATVVNTAPITDTDKTVINVTVESALAPLLASQVATGRIAIVVLTPGSGG